MGRQHIPGDGAVCIQISLWYSTLQCLTYSASQCLTARMHACAAQVGDFKTVVFRQQLLGFNAVRLPFTFSDLSLTPRNFTEACVDDTAYIKVLLLGRLYWLCMHGSHGCRLSCTPPIMPSKPLHAQQCHSVVGCQVNAIMPWAPSAALCMRRGVSEGNPATAMMHAGCRAT